MSKRGQTADERFLCALFQASLSSEEEMIDSYEVGKELGFSEKKVKTILRGLGQANFFRRKGKGGVIMTERGIQLAQELLQSGS